MFFLDCRFQQNPLALPLISGKLGLARMERNRCGVAQSLSEWRGRGWRLLGQAGMKPDTSAVRGCCAGGVTQHEGGRGDRRSGFT